MKAQVVTHPWLHVGLALMTALASALPVAADDREKNAVEGTIHLVPQRCIPFWKVPPGTGDLMGWNQVISFATCIRDASVMPIDDVEMLPELVDGMLENLLIPTTYYLSAAQRGPDPVKLRAIYHIGMSHLSVVIRARRSITPADIATNPAAAIEHAALLASLEPLIAPSARIALMSFALIDRVATVAPELGADPVNTAMIRSARELAVILERDLHEDPETLIGSTMVP